MTMDIDFTANLVGATSWVRANPWTSLFVFVVVHYLYTTYVQPLVQEHIDKWTFDPNRATKLQEEMKQIRGRQQNEARERAVKADQVRKEMEMEERAKKREELERQHLKGGTRLGAGENPSAKNKDSPPLPRPQSTRLNAPLPWRSGDDHIHTIADVSPATAGNQYTTSDGNQGNGNWNTTGTTFMTPDDRWARAERGARFRRNAGPRPAPGNAPSSRGNWGR
mmetsp:Transcript_9001/g.9896  ORF Transcript_9001/g.9896 Transcript_9001/m.9896 type:complete len:223 (+) Transcript_9001:52-720(+)|eukprot:CAMPEP_0195294620 /NCGR_PEP_ID=MMETSP0707-20130614/15534_1 /TAXON_ID=33640 /ORGANISM="Asterionellopsis glacialis, Strain CCMP134" /LENGTH=222 /DNA_ID=CAMNT_0040355645 /DNA_START=46 /DNA_END=714 /DNA_ORIENTATION=+